MIDRLILSFRTRPVVPFSQIAQAARLWVGALWQRPAFSVHCALLRRMRGCLKERKAASYLIWRRPFADSGKTDPELIEHRVVSDRNALVDAADPLRPAYHILRLNRSQAVRFTIGFFLAVTAWVPIGFGQAQPTMILCASARSTFVHDPPRPWTGYGI